jgi:ankyrin repeat protein
MAKATRAAGSKKGGKATGGAKAPSTLEEAIQQADHEAIRAFVARGEPLNPAYAIHGPVPLRQAVDEATGAPDDPMPAVAQLLVELGADVNHRASAYQEPVLFWTAYRGLDALSRWLVAQGASIQGTDHGDQHTMLHCAVEGGLAWLAEQCVAAGIDPNAQTSQGHRAIHYAFTRDTRSSGKDWRALAELLARAGADLAVNNGDWGTALHWAATHGVAPAIAWLVERGIGVDTLTATADGKTPLMLAARGSADRGGAPTLRVLLDLGADARFATPVTGLTPLHCAAVSGDLDSVQVLLDAGADKAAKTRATASFGSTKFKAGTRPADIALRSKWQAGAALLS